MPTGNEHSIPAGPPTPPGHAKDGNGRYVSTIDHASRKAQAARLKADGLTYQQIADQLGYSNKGDAWRAVDSCRKAVLRAAGAELIAAEAALLDDMFAEALDVLARDHPVVSQGKVVKDDHGDPVPDDSVKLAALREMREIRASYRKLLGVDQPTQVAVSGAVRYEVVGVDPADLT